MLMPFPPQSISSNMPIPPELLDPIEAAASLIAPPERLKDLILEEELANPNCLPGGHSNYLALQSRFKTLLTAEDRVIQSARDTFHLEATAEYGLLAATYLIIRASNPQEIDESSSVRTLEQLGFDEPMRIALRKKMTDTYREEGLRPPSKGTFNFHLLEARLRAILVEGERPRPCPYSRHHTHHDEPASLRLSFPHAHRIVCNRS